MACRRASRRLARLRGQEHQEALSRQAAELYGQGASLRQLATQLGLSVEGVRQVLVRQGTDLRPPRGGRRRPSRAAARRFGARLRALRRSAGLSRTALAARAGLGYTTLWYLEAGRRRPSPSTVARLAAALGIPADALGGAR